MSWKRAANKDLVIYRNMEKPKLTIQRRPDSPVFWVMRDGHAQASALDFPTAVEKAGALS